MKDILTEIIANKRIEVENKKTEVSLDSLIKSGKEKLMRPVTSMSQALKNSSSGIIAEFKRKSPSKGWLFPEAEVKNVLPFYEKNGATACSVLTDEKFFGGSIADLVKARELVQLPLLRKDFIIDTYQLYEARIAGADAVLLIASVLSEEECLQLSETAHHLGLEILLEIHRAEEIQYLNRYVNMLGINNRNLATFHTTVENSFSLIEKIQQYTTKHGYSPVLVSESGISNPDMVKDLRSKGFNGFLIGEKFMKNNDPGESLKQFIGGITE